MTADMEQTEYQYSNMRERTVRIGIPLVIAASLLAPANAQAQTLERLPVFDDAPDPEPKPAGDYPVPLPEEAPAGIPFGYSDTQSSRPSLDTIADEITGLLESEQSSGTSGIPVPRPSAESEPATAPAPSPAGNTTPEIEVPASPPVTTPEIEPETEPEPAPEADAEEPEDDTVELPENYTSGIPVPPTPPEWRPKDTQPDITLTGIPVPEVEAAVPAVEPTPSPPPVAPAPPIPVPEPAPAVPAPPAESASPVLNGFETVADPEAERDDVYKSHSQNLSNIQVEMLSVHQPALDQFVRHYQENKARYIAIAERTDLPAPLIAALHWRESGGSFDRYMHNGDPLGKPTVNVPAGKYFENFEDSAVDAFGDKRPLQDKYNVSRNSQDLAAQASYAEYYNGLGYHNKGVASPYVYSGTNIYQSGKYVADGVYDPSVQDKQLGVLLMISAVRDL